MPGTHDASMLLPDPGGRPSEGQAARCRLEAPLGGLKADHFRSASASAFRPCSRACALVSACSLDSCPWANERRFLELLDQCRQDL